MIFLLGGARSGKSSTAVRFAAASGLPVTFIATATASDEDMAARIARHRADRPAEWATVEEPVALAAAVGAIPSGHYLVVDCLTLWVANLMSEGRSDEEIQDLAMEVSDLLRERNGVVVSNEVGMGIHPHNEVARAYRDLLGQVNAIFARGATRSLLTVAGRAVELQPAE